MWFVGDIHGEFDWYLKKGIRSPVDCSVQLGDFGWGFEPVYNRRRQLIKKWSHMQDLSYIPPMPHHRFICGNHDDRMLAKQHPNYLGDYGFISAANLFYISGGFSNDWDRRKPGVEWWEYEELTAEELSGMIQDFSTAKPEVVVSHECPPCAAAVLFPRERRAGNSRTAAALEEAFRCWQPRHWFFGHYHMTTHGRVERTAFRCVGEFQRIELRGLTWEESPKF